MFDEHSQRLAARPNTLHLFACGLLPKSVPVVYIVEDDNVLRRNLRDLLEHEGRAVEDFCDSEEFLASFSPGKEACLMTDANLPGISGLALLEHLNEMGWQLPTIMISGCSGIGVAVQAMKAGAIDFIEKPASCAILVASVDRALKLSRDTKILIDCQMTATAHMEGLTPRQYEVMDMVLAGHPSKNIAADLRISQRTVENHRASIMRKTGTKSLPALARLALAAAGQHVGA